jgi:hypothetical protein
MVRRRQSATREDMTMDRQAALDIRRARRAAMAGQRETLDGRVPASQLAACQRASAEARMAEPAGTGAAAALELRRRELELLRLAGG